MAPRGRGDALFRNANRDDSVWSAAQLPRKGPPKAAAKAVAKATEGDRSAKSKGRSAEDNGGRVGGWSRTTLAEGFPQGPLRKVVVEVMADEGPQADPRPVASVRNGITCTPEAQKMAQRIVRSQWFEFTSGVERIFLVLYCLEAGIRLMADGWSNFKDWWLDLVLIIVGLLALVIIPIFAAATSRMSFEKLLVVRGLRLFRLVRALRTRAARAGLDGMLSHFKIVWRLVYGLLTAAQTIMSMTLLIGVSLFIFACVAVENLGEKGPGGWAKGQWLSSFFTGWIWIIAKDDSLRLNPSDPAIAVLVEENFYGLNRSMLTLLQFVTLDDIADIYYPLCMEKPYLIAFFFPILIFISVGLMNLVTAALVENVTCPKQRVLQCVWLNGHVDGSGIG
eukprot:Skav234615  [mRNA]  locus=scaffold3216:19693:30775:+ [translate_table: standard]